MSYGMHLRLVAWFLVLAPPTYHFFSGDKSVMEHYNFVMVIAAVFFCTSLILGELRKLK